MIGALIVVFREVIEALSGGRLATAMRH